VTEAHAQSGPLTDEEQDFLRALARVLVFLPRAFGADLGHEHGLSMSEFFTLMYLSDSPDGHLRMGDLAEVTALSLGAVTRVAALLVEKGLVERVPNVGDGRVREVGLTEAGRVRLARARPVHEASARRRIFDNLEPSDVRMCTAMLSRMSEESSASSSEGRKRP